MREDDWGPERLPFHAAAEPFETASFEEAAARLLFLADRRWPVGWLFGPTGCGKTTLLRSVRRELRRGGSEALLVSLCGVEGDEFWPVIAEVLGSTDGVSGLAARKTVRALLVASAMIDRPVTFLLDDADRGGTGLWDQIAAFVRMAEGVTPNHSVIVATAGELPSGDLARRVDLRAEVRPFAADETAEFVARRLDQAGGRSRFAPEAIAELFAATAGVPAAVGRIADLALVAAHAAGVETVTVEIVRSAASDLRPMDDEPLVSLPAMPRPARFSA